MPPRRPEERVILTYRRQAALLRARVVSFVERRWGRMSSWRDADIDRFIADILPIVEAGQRQVASLTDAYLASLATIVLGEPQRPLGVDPDTVTTEALRGVPADEVYRRGGITVWTALSNGAPLSDAVAQGLHRVSDIASTSIQLAKTHTSRAALEKMDVVGYRRVLEGKDSCSLCKVASTQRYHAGDLLPIHGKCDCGVAPIFGTKDPGRIINQELLTELDESGEYGELLSQLEVRDARKALESAKDGAKKLKEDLDNASTPAARERIQRRLDKQVNLVRERTQRFDSVRAARRERPEIVVHQHGELGPVLGVQGQHFTGPAAVA